MSSRRSKSARRNRSKVRSRADAEQMLGDVRREVHKLEQVALKRNLTGDDATEFLFRVRVAAYPQHK